MPFRAGGRNPSRACQLVGTGGGEALRGTGETIGPKSDNVGVPIGAAVISWRGESGRENSRKGRETRTAERFCSRRFAFTRLMG
jgi:hypothetical protein